MQRITSRQNSVIKELAKPSFLAKKNLVLIEGIKEISIALEAEIKLQTLFYCPELVRLETVQALVNKDVEIYEVTQPVFSKIAYRETTGGMVAVAERPNKKLEDLSVRENSIYIVLDAIEKPGNLGAICRVADAANVDGIIVTNLHTDIYNPNVIRSSLGCVFTVDVVCADFEETVHWLKNNQIMSYAAELKNSNTYYLYNFEGKIAFVFGTESTGLPEKWINEADYRIKIPMLGKIDSLNVNTSVAVMVFEAKRQMELKRKG